MTSLVIFFFNQREIFLLNFDLEIDNRGEEWGDGGKGREETVLRVRSEIEFFFFLQFFVGIIRIYVKWGKEEENVYAVGKRRRDGRKNDVLGNEISVREICGREKREKGKDNGFIYHAEGHPRYHESCYKALKNRIFIGSFFNCLLLSLKKIKNVFTHV